MQQTMRDVNQKIRRRRGLKTCAVATAVGMFFVNVMGFVDTATGSTFGCGNDWPLCNGQLIPSKWGLHTLIEFAHRSIVGIVTMLLFVTAVWAWLSFRRRAEIRLLIGVSVLFVFAQAFLGAMAVKFTNPPAVLALHFGFSLLAFSGVWLLAVVIWQLTSAGSGPDVILRQPYNDRGLRVWVWGALAYVYAAVYYGAFVTSSGAGNAFTGWPFPTGQDLSHFSWMQALDLLHRLVALGLLIISVLLVRRTRRLRTLRPDLYRGSLWLLIFVCLQALSGGYLVLSHVNDLKAFLLHVSMMTGLFASLFYLALQVMPDPIRRRAATVATRHQPAQS